MWEVIENNKRKSILALSLMFILYCLIYGGMISLIIYGVVGADNPSSLSLQTHIKVITIALLIPTIVFIIALLVNMNKPYMTDTGRMYKVTKSNYPQLYNIVEEILIASGANFKPSVYVLDSDILNAYACGLKPNKSSVVVSRALLEILNREELQGVIAHEISHIINRDTTYLLCSGLMFIVSAAVTRLLLDASLRARKGRAAALMLVLFLISLIGQGICFLLFMFVSRKREYLADASASRFTRYPKGLADALLKIENGINTQAKYMTGANHLIKASFIVPVECKGDSLLSTHPSTQNRVKILMSMTTADYNAYEKEFERINKRNLIPKSVLEDKNVAEIKHVQNNNVLSGEAALVCALNSSIKNKEQAEILRSNEQAVKENIERHREVKNVIFSLAEYVDIQCECGTRLKIPPVYKDKMIVCPHCGKKHIASSSK